MDAMFEVLKSCLTEENQILFLERGLTKRWIDINASDRKGMTLLMYAVLRNFPRLVHMLVNIPGLDINHVSVYGHTALTLAIYGENDDIIISLCKTPGIRAVNGMYHIESEYLMKMVIQGDYNMVEHLLMISDLDINYLAFSEYTVLNLSCQLGDTRLVKRILEFPGIDINRTCAIGETALIKAARINKHEIVKILLKDRNLKLDHKNNNGDTALGVAIAEGNREVARVIYLHNRMNG